MALRYLAALLTLLLLLPLAGCVQEATSPPSLESPPGLRPVGSRSGQTPFAFSTGACTRDMDPYSPPEAGITETIWENESTLLVKGFLKTWCGGAEISGDYLLEADNLTLFYTISTPGPVTSCLCTRGVQYRITGLPRREYRVAMEGR